MLDYNILTGRNIAFSTEIIQSLSKKLRYLLKKIKKLIQRDMSLYSQNNEETILLNYFKNFKGSLLDLGANDGRTFSNSLRLIQLGWEADLVEASPETFKKLELEHKGNEKVKCHNVAVSNVNGSVKFYESGTLLGGDDRSLVSTLDKRELDRWGGKVAFTETAVKSLTFNSLLDITKNHKFDFITIDIEGLDWLVLSQMNLTDLGCKLLIIETNGKEVLKYIAYCKQFGLNTLATNGENLILSL